MGASRRRGNVPNIVNTPTGPREREERPRMPVTRPRDISYKVPDRERREEAKRQETSGDSFGRQRDRRMAGDRTGFFGRVKKRPGEGFLGTRLPIPTGRPTRGDRPGGFPTRGPAPDTRDRKPIENFTGTFGMADGSPETIRKRKEAFEKKVNNLSPERRKEFDENRLKFRFTEEEGGRPTLGRSPGYTINFRRGTTPEERKRAYEKYRPKGFRPFPSRNQDQNIARTDI